MTHHESAYQKFIELCQDPRQLPLSLEFFDLFFTAEEKQDLANRYLIVQALLQQQQTQRQMAKDLHVSIAKITRGANELKTISPALKRYLEAKLK